MFLSCIPIQFAVSFFLASAVTQKIRACNQSSKEIVDVLVVWVGAAFDDNYPLLLVSVSSSGPVERNVRTNVLSTNRRCPTKHTKHFRAFLPQEQTPISALNVRLPF